MLLKGKTAIVTGAARRVGRVIAEALAAKGANVAVHYNRSASEARKTAEDLSRKYKVNAVSFPADLGSVAEVKALVEAVHREYGRIDILVNSASLYEKTRFGTITELDWDRQFASNLKGPFFLSQAAGEIMREQGAGKIVNISDWAALRPYPQYIPYCLAKAGLFYMTHALAKALAPQVQVNSVLPGPVLLPEDVGPKERKAIEEATLVKRIGSPQDVADAVLYLIGQDFTTGAGLTVDGGRLVNSARI